jgi:hypothetical protein
VPAAAARLANVETGDANPLVRGGVGQHPPQQLAVAGLDLDPLAQPEAGGGDPLGEPVADPLQLAEPEQARLGSRRRHPVLDLDVAEPRREEAGKLPFQPPDLLPQVGAGEALVCPGKWRGAAVSLQQIRHRNPGPV